MKKETLFVLLIGLVVSFGFVDAQSQVATTKSALPRSSERVAVVAPATRPALQAALSSEGDLYLVRQHSVQIFNVAARTVESVSQEFVPRTIESEGETLRQQYLLCVAFDRNNPKLLWTARTTTDYASYVTSLNTQETMRLSRALIGPDCTFSPSGDLYAHGSGPDLDFAVHRFSSSGQHLQSFHDEKEFDLRKLLSTTTSIFAVSGTPGEPVYEYSFDGHLQHVYHLNDEATIGPGKVAAVVGAFVRNGTTHVEAVIGESNSSHDHEHSHGETGCRGCGDSADGGPHHHFGGIAETLLFQLQGGNSQWISSSETPSALYGITADGTRIGRSLRVSERGHLVVETMQDQEKPERLSPTLDR